MVAFRLHLPARIRYHNAPTRRVERGNILEWEQSLADRLKGEPVRIEARMDQQSILYSTLRCSDRWPLLVVDDVRGDHLVGRCGRAARDPY